MAKKRKLTPKSGESQKQKQKKQEQEEEEEHQLLNQVVTEAQEPEEEEEQEDEEAEIEGEEEEEEEEETVKQEEDTVKQEENNDDDGEPIHKLLEPFSKEQLINILAEVAEKHAQIAARVRRIADEDPVHRKIFVHGLGWDTTTETLQTAFVQYGEIEDCKSVTDKVTGKSKGYGFILFKSRSGARKALEQPQKKIGSRMASCQLAAMGPGPGPGPTSVASASSQAVALNQPVSEYIQRKIYVSNVGAELDPQKLYAFFAKFGEIDEGPLGLDKQTGKPKGFCLFVYKTAESAKKALEEPHKNFEGQILHCQQANDGQKAGKQQFNQQRNSQYGRNNNNNNMNYAGSVGGVAQGGGQMMGQSVSAMPFNQGAAVAAPGAYNPALNQALTALLSSQNGLGLQNLLGPLGTNGAVQGIQGAYGNQALNMGMLGGYGAQTGVQNAYTNQQQGGARTQHGNGHMGGMPPYTGR